MYNFEKLDDAALLKANKTARILLIVTVVCALAGLFYIGKNYVDTGATKWLFVLLPIILSVFNNMKVLSATKKEREKRRI